MTDEAREGVAAGDQRRECVAVSFSPPLRSGGKTPVAAWSRSEEHELVVHGRISSDGISGHNWVVSHRRSGLALNQDEGMSSKEAALALLDELEPAAQWSRVNADGAGWTKKERQAYADICRSIIDKHAVARSGL